MLASFTFASFVVSPAQDSFEVLQNSSVSRVYLVENNDTSGKIEITTSVVWAEDTTDYLNVTPGKDYTAKVTIRPAMMPPGNYTAMVTFSDGAYSQTARINVQVVKTNWIYGYLLPQESYRDITYANETIDSVDYSLVSFKGAETFLVKNNREIVRDQTEIKRFYERYYRDSFYPSDSELATLNGLVQEFNTSRNQKVRYSSNFGAEEACLLFTGISHMQRSTGHACLTITDATLSCQIVHSEDMAACGEPAIIYGTLDFGTNIFNLDNNLSAFSKQMAGLSLDNAASSLDAAKGYMEKVRTNAESAANSKLRWDSKCMDCIGACPVIPYNISALNQSISMLNTLRTKAQQLKNPDTQAGELLSKTQKRISDVLGKEHKDEYQKRYDVIKPLSDDVTERVLEATSNVKSPELEEKFARMKNASASLEWIIENGDYSNVYTLDAIFDSNVDRFYSAKGEVETLLGSTNGVYDVVSETRQNASDYLIIAEMNVQTGDPTIGTLEELRSRMAELDANFTLPLDVANVEPLSAGYGQIKEEAQQIAESKPSSSIVGRMVSKIMRTEKWVAVSVIGLGKPLSLSERTAIGEYITPASAVLFDFFLALALLLVMAAYAVRNRKRLGAKRTRQEIILFSAFACATLIVAALCTGAMYYLTVVYGGERTLNLFTFEINKAGGAAVVVDEASAYLSQNPDATLEALRGCGQRMGGALSDYQANVYFVNGMNCRVNGTEMNYTDCESQFMNLPIIYIRHGERNLVSFRTMYAVNATLEGEDSWLEACHLARALR